MKCRVCGYTSNEDFDRVTVDRPDGCGITERLPTGLHVCPNCGTAKVKTEKEKTECPWCSPRSEYTIIDDDFGQPLHPNMIKFCFNCGRELRKDGKK